MSTNNRLEPQDFTRFPRENKNRKCLDADARRWPQKKIKNGKVIELLKKQTTEKQD